GHQIVQLRRPLATECRNGIAFVQQHAANAQAEPLAAAADDGNLLFLHCHGNSRRNQAAAAALFLRIFLNRSPTSVSLLATVMSPGILKDANCPRQASMTRLRNAAVSSGCSSTNSAHTICPTTGLGLLRTMT